MYFLEQIKNQFLCSVVNYNHHAEAGFGPEKQDDIGSKAPEGPKSPDDVVKMVQEAKGLETKAGSLASKGREALAGSGNTESSKPVNDSSKETGKEGMRKGPGESNEGVAEMDDAVAIHNITSSEAFSEIPAEEIQDVLQEIDLENLENPEGMTREEAIEGAINEVLEKEVPSEILLLKEGLGEEVINELTEKYGNDKLEAFSEIYSRLLKEGVDIPDNIEEFEQMMIDEIVKREALELGKEYPNEQADEGVLRNAARNILLGSSSGHIRGYNGAGGERGRDFNFPSGNATQDIAQLDNAIQEAPNEQAKALLMAARRYVGMNETSHNSELRSFLGFDPASTPWCKGFTNSCCKEANISLNSSGSLYSRAGVNDGRKLNLPQENPQAGDIVIVERAGTVGNGAPAGHICIFVGMSPNGNPIVIGGNQGGSREGGGGVTITEEKRPIVSINRVAENRVS